MKYLEFLKNTPASKTARYGLLIAMTLTLVLAMTGFYSVTRYLAAMGSNHAVGIEFDAEGGDILQPGGEALLPMFDLVPEGILTPWDGASRVTILVMGLDYRDWSVGEGPSRTDTMILLTMDPLNNTAGMLSIPRDLWVSIPGFENGRINTAYFLGEAYQLPGGGPALAVKTVEQLLGVTINYYAQIDFAAFVRFIDEIGGVKIDVPEKIKIDPIVGDPVILKPERQTLYGELALAYARARNTEGGDLDRASRQQQVILGIRDRLLSPEALSLLITKAPTLYNDLVSGVRANLQLDELIKLALLAQQIPEDQIVRQSISTSAILLAESPDEQSVLVPIPDEIRQIRDEVFLASTGTMGPLAPGSQQERMAAEAAKIALLNGSLVEGLGGRTKAYLQSLGVNIVEVSNGEYTAVTRLIDYTGNPHTARYFIELFGIPSEFYVFEFDPNRSIDVVITLGAHPPSFLRIGKGRICARPAVHPPHLCYYDRPGSLQEG